jgi:hypothetical protein
MTSRLYCTLDDAAAGPGLLVLEGNLTATTTDNALDIHRAIHGTLAVSAGVYYYEVIYWSGLQSSLANLVSFGVTQPQGSLSKYVGEESVSYGWRFADGAVYNNGASVASTNVYGERLTLGCLIYLTPSQAIVGFSVNGSIAAQVTLPTGKTWVPAFTLSGGPAGDLKIQANFGQTLFDHQPTSSVFGMPLYGWSQQSPGLATLRLSKVTEAFMSAHTDSPADTPFAPKLLNWATFSIKKAPQHWAHRADPLNSTPVPTSIAPLVFDNSDGEFNDLLAADVRDSPVTIDALPAPAGGFGALSSATRMATMNIDSVTAPSASTVQVTLKGRLAQYDVPMKMHLIPPYYVAASAGKWKPFGIGAQRNFNPVLLDEAQNLYLLGDTPFSNIPLVMDNAAPLDPLAPQWTGALGGTAIQLTSPAVGKLSCDGSTVGPQYQSGVNDVLGDIGAFTTWTAGVPNGWAKPTGAPFDSSVISHGSITQTSAYGTTSALMIQSNVPYTPGHAVGEWYGYPVYTSSTYLQPGRTYRFSFKILNCLGQFPENYGLAILTGLADDKRYWVTDYRQPLHAPASAPAYRFTYVYEYTVPASFPALPIYLCAISKFGGASPSTAGVNIVIDDLRVELLGQFTRAPLSTVTLDGAMNAILVQHQGEDDNVYSSADAQAIQSATIGTGGDTGLAIDEGYVWGLRYTEPPNVVNAMQTALDQFGAVMFEDEDNQIRFRRLTDPADGTPVAQFDESNVDPDSISIVADEALGLTTLFGARPNCDPNAENDFVSDPGIVTPATRAALMGPAQYNITATVKPAQEYAAAEGAPRFITRLDSPTQCLAEGNRNVSIWSQKYADGGLSGLSSGKRRLVTFTAFFDGMTLGVAPYTTQPHQLYYNDVVLLNLPDVGLDNVQGAVLSTELFPFAGKITIEALV